MKILRTISILGLAVAAASLLVMGAAAPRRMIDLPSTNSVAETNIALTTGGAHGTNSWQVLYGNILQSMISWTNFYRGVSNYASTRAQGLSNNHSAAVSLLSTLSSSQLDVSGSSGEASSILSTALEVYQTQYRTELRLVPTNSALSNIVVDFALTNTVEIYNTNNLTFTNWSFSGGWGGLPTSRQSSKLIIIRPQLINRGVNWGNLGLSNPGYSIAIATNANNLLWTTLTNGRTYALSLSAVGTNIFPTLTLWQ